MADAFSIRPLDPERDGPQIVELIRELNPHAVLTVESWRQQQASIPARARKGAWVAAIGDTIVGRAEGEFNWYSESGSVFAGASVRAGFQRRGIGSRLWETVDAHIRELAPTRVLTMFIERPEAVRFARARGFVEARAETLSSVDPRTVDLTLLDELRSSVGIVPLRDVPPEAIFEVDVATTADVPMTDALTDIRFDEWVENQWHKPTLALDGSFAAIEDGRVSAFTMLTADLESGRAYNDYTGTMPYARGRGFATAVKLASLRWAAVNAVTAVWTSNDETNAPMLTVNRRLGYRPSARRVEYVRDAPEAETATDRVR
jgi:GNAT superfamily N-acetyltransferase